MTATNIKRTQPTGPTAPSATAQAGGGSFAGGVQFFYKVTAVIALLGESAVSSEVNATPAASGHVDLAWTNPAGTVTAVRVYRGTVTNSENVLVAQVQGNPAAYSDLGGAGTAATPPTTAANAAVTKSGAAVTKANVLSTQPGPLGLALYQELVEWCAMSSATTAGTAPCAPQAKAVADGAGWTISEV